MSIRAPQGPLGSLASRSLGEEPFFRGGTYVQSVINPSYPGASPAGSLGSAGSGRVIATMDPSDSRRGPPAVIDSQAGVTALTPPPRRVSQVPRLICPRVLSPFTPGSPAGAGGSLDSPAGGRLHRYLAGWPSSISVTRPKRVHAFALRPAGLLRGASTAGLLPTPPASLPVERAIDWITTFQVTRSARLILAHQKAQKAQIFATIEPMPPLSFAPIRPRAGGAMIGGYRPPPPPFFLYPQIAQNSQNVLPAGPALTEG